MIEEKISDVEVLKYNEDIMESISYNNLFFINQNTSNILKFDQIKSTSPFLFFLFFYLVLL